MSIPDTPYTRKEAYLNAAATGDSSGIPETPYTREEMYLDAIARNGGGGGGGGGLVRIPLTNSDGTITLQKTGQEILDYIGAGYLPYVVYAYNELHPDLMRYYIFQASGVDILSEADPPELLYWFTFGGDLYLTCPTLSDYPTG